MADLQSAADQFARDLVSQNIAGLMVAFTPEGMGKAMAMQAQTAGQPQPTPSGFEVKVVGQDGDDHMVDLVMNTADGDRTISTTWRDIAGSWKVHDIGVKA
jgi:hypothetical protein